MGKKILVYKILVQKILWSKKFLGQKKFLVKKIFWTKKFLGRKNFFGQKNFLVKKNFWSKKNFGQGIYQQVLNQGFLDVFFFPLIISSAKIQPKFCLSRKSQFSPIVWIFYRGKRFTAVKDLQR